MALLGLGIKRLSISPAAIGPVKAMVRSFNLAKLQKEMAEAMDGRALNLRPWLIEWAAANAVDLV